MLSAPLDVLGGALGSLSEGKLLFSDEGRAFG
jgi:hypothetical protein